MNNSGVNGNGWVNTELPFLSVYSTFNPQTRLNDKPVVAFNGSGQGLVLFDVSMGTGSGTWTSRFTGQHKLSYSATTDEWTLTDSTGNKLTFNDLPRSTSGNLSASPTDGYANQGSFGKIKTQTDSGGVLTTYSYYASGTAVDLVQTIERSDASGQAERFEYTYSTVSNSLGGNAVLLESVSHTRRATSAGAFTAVRSVTYTYYTGEGTDAEHGRLGDLKLATIHDGGTGGAVIDQKYYRYNKMWGYARKLDGNPANNPATAGGTDTTFTRYTTNWNDPFFNVFQSADNQLWSGLKMAVEGEAFSRLTANYSNYEAATDNQVKPYVNNFYRYERWSDVRWNYETYANADFAGDYHYYTRYRVTEEISQGAGCSTCSGGQGAYKFETHINPGQTGSGNDAYDPNAWRMRTIEYLPDTTNADADNDSVIDEDQWADNDRNIVYLNEFGQVVLKVLADVDGSSSTLSGISRSGTTVTVTSAGHGLSTGDQVAFNNAVASATGLPQGIPAGNELPMYNGVFTVTVVDANTFTYALSHVPDNTATPEASEMRWSKVANTYADYYRYSQETATGSGYVGNGQLVLHASPSAVSGWSESYVGLVTNGLSTSYNNEFLKDNEGLITLYTYYSSTTATATTPGGVAGYQWQTKLKHGENDGGSNVLGGGILQDRYQYFERAGTDATVYPVANYITYRNTDGTGLQTTSYNYTWYAGLTQAESVTTTRPTATSAQNGPNSGDQETQVFDTYGRPVWTRDGSGYIHYTEYDPGTGAVVKMIRDVNTALVSNEPSGWATPSDGGLHLTTTMQVDGLGRTTKLTDPNGNVTHTVYKDAEHETRTYRGWNATTGTPTGPLEITREYRPTAGATSGQRTVYTESLSTSATPTVSGSAGSYVPTGNETINASNVQSLTRWLTNDAGQNVETNAYFSMAGVTYGQASPRLGIASNDSATGNYHSSYTDYDGRGWLKRTEDATGTISRMTYDARGLMTQTWVGTDDVPTSGFWSPTNDSGTNLSLVAEKEYDNGGIGNGNLTEVTNYPGGGTAARVTQHFYDWRDRLNATKTGVEAASIESATPETQRQIIFYVFDNRDKLIESQKYDGDNVTLVDSGGDGVWDKPSSTLLRSYEKNEYDNRGRVFRNSIFSVDSTTGTISANALVTGTWYDRRNNVIKVDHPGTADDKMQHDGAGRMVKSFKTDSGGDTTWSTARDVSGDHVLEQTETAYDATGNAILMIARHRFHDATGTGELRVRTSTVTPSRAQHTAFYYDAANRLTHSADLGTNGGNAYARPSAPPARSDTAFVTSYGYDAAGRVQDVIDPKALMTRTGYDLLGRTTQTTANHVDGIPSAVDDQTTVYTHTGTGKVLTMKAVLPGGTFQETKYIYAVSQAMGSDIDSNNLLSAIQYPNRSTGMASSGEQETFTVNALGRRTTKEDRNNNVHAYAYDVLGRSTADMVTAIGAGVDGAIRRIETTYDTQGLPFRTTSFDAASGGNIVNQIQRAYNGLGQLTAEYQANNGAVNTTTTPKVQYAYSEMANGANHSRLTSMTYPNGHMLNYNYIAGTGASGIDDRISRLSSLTDASATLETLVYLGLDTVVKRAHPQSGADLTYIKLTGESNGDSQDQYTGLDRFNRVVDQRWNSGTMSLDRFAYGYDRNGNRLYKQNLVDSGNSELYGYDGLDRLTGMQRGTLDGTKTALTGAAVRSQSWSLDALGNSGNVTTDGVAETRTHNAQNQLMDMGGDILVFDANGNVATDQTGKTFLYDAWNRLVEAKSGSTTLIRYEHDGAGRRIEEGSTALYYSSQWQVVEERESGLVTVQRAWSPVYIDAAIAIDRDSDANGTLDERNYVLQDANFNVIALVNTTGGMVERYLYDSYGKRTVLDGNWAADADGLSDVLNRQGHQGGLIDKVIAYHINFRNRILDVDAMRWTQQDQLLYVDGSNLYEFARSSPLVLSDPLGLSCRIAYNCVNVGSTTGKLTTSCDYQCVEDQTVPRVDAGGGTVNCDDPRLKGPQSITDTTTVLRCNSCPPTYNTTRHVSDWSDPGSDCSKQECLAGADSKFKVAKLACKALKGAAKTACNAVATAAYEAMRGACGFCEKP